MIKDKFDEQQEKELNTDLRKKQVLMYSLSIIGLILIGIVGWQMYAWWINPAEHDVFVQCLNSKETVLYGDKRDDPTIQQLNLFGRSARLINYENYRKTEGIRVLPTWSIDGIRYEGVKSLQELSEISGC